MSLGLLEQHIIPEPMSGCWIWLGALGTDGYGMGLDGEAKRTSVAHRLVYEILVGKIPKGKCLLHRCDNRCCVNPDHMFVGSRGDNNRDRHAKGRTALGEAHGMSKLTEPDVLSIRSSTIPYEDLAVQYGVSVPAIQAIKQRRLWKSLPGPIIRSRRGPRSRSATHG